MSAAEHLDYLEQVADDMQQRRSASRAQQDEDQHLSAASPTPSSALSSDFGGRSQQPQSNPVSSVVEAYNNRQQQQHQYRFNDKRVQRIAATARSPSNATHIDGNDTAHSMSQSGNDSAHRRLAAWSQMREETMQKLREEKDRLDAVNMPFQPHVHRAPKHGGTPPPSNSNSRSTSAATGPQQQPVASASTQQRPATALSAKVLHTHDARSLPVEQRLNAMQVVVDENLKNLRDVKYRDPELTFHPEVHYHPVHDHQPSVVDRTTDSQRQRDEVTQASASTIQASRSGISGGAPSPGRGGLSPRTAGNRTLSPNRTQGTEQLSRVEREELLECTFQPAIGPRSKRVYETSRIEEGKMDVYNRLYSRSSAAAKSRNSTMTSMVNTSQQHHSTKKQKKQDMPPLPEDLQDELDVLRAHCNLRNDKTDNFGTFLCNVLGVKTPESLPPPVDTPHYLCRLTEEHISDDDMEYPGSGGGGGASGEAASTSGPANNNKAASRSSSEHQPGSTTVTIDFDEFLARQSEMERQRHQNRATLEAQYAPPLQPTICRESRKMAERRKERTLLETSGGTPNDKENSRFQRKSSYVPPTFKPVISAVAEQCPRRGVDRLHRYHTQYKTHIEELREKKDQQDDAHATFKPQTNKNYKHVDSMLNAKNLKAYKEHLAKTKEQAAQKKLTIEAIEEHELHQQCTFRPKINRTPSYVANMAHSFSAIRDAQLELTATYGQKIQHSPRWVN